jgi:hypothetical protein
MFEEIIIRSAEDAIEFGLSWRFISVRQVQRVGESK